MRSASKSRTSTPGHGLAHDFSAVANAPASSISGKMTANSSPPTRASTSWLRSRGLTTWASLPKKRVAGDVAERVVGLLEVVHVEDEERQRPLVALAAGDPRRSSVSLKYRRLKSWAEPVDRHQPVDLFVVARLDVAAEHELEDGPPDLHLVAVAEVALRHVDVVHVGSRSSTRRSATVYRPSRATGRCGRGAGSRCPGRCKDRTSTTARSRRCPRSGGCGARDPGRKSRRGIPLRHVKMGRWEGRPP